MLEKSSCLQLTRSEYELIIEAFRGEVVDLVKISSVLTSTGYTSDEIDEMLKTGQYRIVED
jgi:acetolactate synthase small subunit